MRLVAYVAVLAQLAAATVAANERPVRIVALGDSLTAGYQLASSQAFPARLERALRAKGIAVEIVNAGVSGDTASGGLARLNWSVPDGTEAVILALGANDMLRGIDPAVTRQALDRILTSLRERRIEVLLVGMRAVPNLGPEYRRAFEAIYTDLAATHGVLLYPFFLDGVAADPRFNLGDRIHPNAAGVEVMVGRILPKVEELIARVLTRR
ncbi:MAG TPA: arylesterase [Xanthobacteraceae bacterium]|nr:arylesterase [Xanthobacteraceae bacterium]